MDTNYPDDRLTAAAKAHDQANENPIFRAFADSGDASRDAGRWLEGYRNYREALDILPHHSAYIVQMGHCLKEMGCLEAAECAYRTALLLGAPVEDVSEHLIFASRGNRHDETQEAVRAIGEAVFRREHRLRVLPTLDDLLVLVATFDISQHTNTGQLADWMRRQRTYAQVVEEITELYGASCLTPYWLNSPALGAIVLPGLPRWSPAPRRATAGAVLSPNIVMLPSASKTPKIGRFNWLRRRLQLETAMPLQTSFPIAAEVLKESSSAVSTPALNRSCLLPVLFQFTYGATATPASVGDNDDTRALAVGWRNAVLRRVGETTPIQTIDFRQSGNARDHVAFGFSSIDPWGTWSLGGVSGLMVWAGSDLGDLELELDASPYLRAFETVEITVTSSLGHKGRLQVAADGHSRATLIRGETSGTSTLAGSTDEGDISRNLSLVENASPCVSIIILNYNRAPMSILSVQSVLACGIGVSHEIIVVDNGSTAHQYSLLIGTPLQFRVHRNSANRYFGEGNNLGAESARGEFLLFLNNDAFLAPGAVDAMLAAFRAVPSCGASGAVMRYPDGLLQEAGAMVRPDGTAEQRGKYDRHFDVAAMAKFEVVDYVSAACVLLRAETFTAVGGFNYRYDPAYYEDTDLCFRLRLLGLSTVVARDAKCIHIESATTSDRSTSSGAHNVVDHNRAVFLSVWRPFLTGRNELALPRSSLLPPRAFNPRVDLAAVTQVVISPFPLVPGGGERYILATGLSLSRFGPSALVTPDSYSNLRLRNVLSDLGLKTDLGGPFVAREILDLPIERSVLIGNEVVPHSTVPSKRRFFVCQFPFPMQQLSAAQIASGLARLNDYEKVIVYSKFAETAYRVALDDLGAKIEIEVVAPPIDTAAYVALKLPKLPRIVSIGRFTTSGHSKRQDILLKAYKAATAAFRREWTLTFCGIVPNEPAARDYFHELQAAAKDEPNVEFIIAPSLEQLQHIVGSASVYVHATGFGITKPSEYWRCEHFGITVVEALAAGCQTYAFAIGGPPEIFERLGTGSTFDTIEELTAILTIAEVGGISDALRQKVGRTYSDEAFTTKMAAAIF